MDGAASIAGIVDKARTSWLKNHEVLELLQEYANAGLSVCQEPPVRPEGGQLFLFDRRACRFFRRDGHNWRKKPDGKTIRETHEKLKVGNMEALNCYYAHADQDDGLQRRCYWQLDSDKEHIVLVHYLCCASSRAGGATQRAGSAEAAEGVRERPRRGAAARRAYSPPPRSTRGRQGSGSASQTKLSSLTQSSGSLEGSVPSGGLPEVTQLTEVAQLELPLVQGMGLQQAAALPSLEQQYAERLAAQHAAQLAATASVQALPPMPLPELDPFALPADELSRPHPGVLYTGQRMASQLAAAQLTSSGVLGPLPVASAASAMPAAAVAAPAVLPAGADAAAPVLPPAAMPPPPPFGGPRTFYAQESFASEQHRNLFRQMSLGIQRDTVEEVAGFFLGSPTERSLDPLGGGTGDAAKPAASPEAGALTPGADLAALLASPHRRTFSRQGSGLSRLISKNWESELPMDMMLQDVDADISTYPVGEVEVEVVERPSSPSSRIFDRAGIAFLGSASMAAATSHTLEPSPLAGLAGVTPLRGLANSPFGGSPAFLGGMHSADRSDSETPKFGSPPSHLLFAAGDASARAQRAPRDRPCRRDASLGGSAGMPRVGSHQHMAHLARRSLGTPLGADAAPEDADAAAQQRRQERVEAAVVAAQEHRDEALAAARSRRGLGAAVKGEAGEGEDDEGLEMIDVPENMQRLSSFLTRGRQTTGGREFMTLAAAEALEFETRSLLKHMSIDEADALAALSAVPSKAGVDVMPTIHADNSSELEATLSAGPQSTLGSLSGELALHNLSVASHLDSPQDSALQPSAAAHSHKLR